MRDFIRDDLVLGEDFGSHKDNLQSTDDLKLDGLEVVNFEDLESLER